MSEFIHNKTSGFFVTLLIGIIVLSFMFTGYQAFEGRGSTNVVGKVGDYQITAEEYQQEYNRQIEFFKQMFGGEVTAKQIESMKIKESIVRNLIQRKLMLVLSNELGTYPSDEAIKAEIKELPYFKTDNQFDVTKYKSLLAMNKLTPQQFEEDVTNQMKMKSLTELSSEFPLSDSYLADLQKFREDKLSIDLVTFTKDSIRKHIAVTPEELQKFLAVEVNKNRISSMYNDRKASLDKPEEVTARHILVRSEGKAEADVKAQIEKIAKEVTASNFAKMADKYTEDPSGKGKGGSLGAFARGMMVPEFDKVAFEQKVGTISAPVKTNFGYQLILVEKKTPATVSKLADYQDKFATELIQKDKVEEIKKLTVELSNNLKKALEANNEKEVKSLVEKYGLSMKKAEVNKIDGVSTGANLSAQNMKEIFEGDLTKSKVILADDGNTINMIKTYPKAAPTTSADPAKNAENNASLKNVLNRKMMEGLLKNLEKDTRIKLFSNLAE